MVMRLVLMSIVIGLSLLDGDVTAAGLGSQKQHQRQFVRLVVGNQPLGQRKAKLANSRAALKAGYGSQPSSMPAPAPQSPPQVFVISAPAPASQPSKPAPAPAMSSYKPAPPPMMKYPPAMSDPHAAPMPQPAAQSQSQSYRVIYVQPPPQPAPAAKAPSPPAMQLSLIHI